jgi:hypothetical protein
MLLCPWLPDSVRVFSNRRGKWTRLRRRTRSGLDESRFALSVEVPPSKPGQVEDFWPDELEAGRELWTAPQITFRPRTDGRLHDGLGLLGSRGPASEMLFFAIWQARDLCYLD